MRYSFYRRRKCFREQEAVRDAPITSYNFHRVKDVCGVLVLYSLCRQVSRAARGINKLSLAALPYHRDQHHQRQIRDYAQNFLSNKKMYLKNVNVVTN